VAKFVIAFSGEESALANDQGPTTNDGRIRRMIRAVKPIEKNLQAVVAVFSPVTPRIYSVTVPGATKFLLPEGTTLVTMHVIIGGLFWLLSL
jgi:hypothetical protein